MTIDLEAGLPPVRREWIAKRGFASDRAARGEARGQRQRPGDRLVPPCPAERPVLGGRPGQPVTQIEFARAGIITEEMIYVAHRENLGRAKVLAGAEERRADGEGFGAAIPAFVTPEFVREEIASRPRDHSRPTSTTRSSSRSSSAATSWSRSTPISATPP